MTELVKELERQAHQLAAEERAQLAELLLESLHEGPIAEIEGAWAVASVLPPSKGENCRPTMPKRSLLRRGESRSDAFVRWCGRGSREASPYPEYAANN